MAEPTTTAVIGLTAGSLAIFGMVTGLQPVLLLAGMAGGWWALSLRDPLPLPFPVRLLHGTADTDVPLGVALRLMDHAAGPDLQLTLVKDADHRFSSPACLALIETAIGEVS